MKPEQHLDRALAVLTLLADDAEADGIHWHSATITSLISIITDELMMVKATLSSTPSAPPVEPP